MILNENTITDMGQLSNLSYISYGDQIAIGEQYNGLFAKQDSNGNTVQFNLISNYTVIDYVSTGNSMEALLLKNESTGRFVIAFRGTQETGDILTDFLIGLSSLATGTITAWNAQYSDAINFVNEMLVNHADIGLSLSNLTLTGHSLGGILAQSIAAENGLEAYTFNGLGTSGLTRFTETNSSNIVNLSYTDDGMLNGDILSNALSFAGNQHLGEVLPMIGPDLGLDAHKMGYMNMVIAMYNNILSHFTPETDYRDVSQAYRINTNTATLTHTTSYQKTIEYFADVDIYESGTNLQFNFLNDLSAFQIAQQAKSDSAVLFALIKLNGFAVEGTLGSYSNLNLAEYSSNYIEDRSLLLYHMLDPNKRPLGDLYIKERAYGISVGGDGWNYNNPQIIFGYDGVTAAPEELIGGIKADHLFGMGGDDILIGDKGDDYLEGGEGKEYNYNLNLNLNTYSAQEMVHLTVNNEFKANFPLQSFHNSHSKPRIAA